MGPWDPMGPFGPGSGPGLGPVWGFQTGPKAGPDPGPKGPIGAHRVPWSHRVPRIWDYIRNYQKRHF